MSHEIKTATIKPIRNTYLTTEQRFGDKPASRYQEASFDIQSVENFHYRPVWQPQFEINDANRTAIKMKDWYALKDPRQFYYATYVTHRAKLQENAENSYAFFEKRKLGTMLSDEVRDRLINFVIPFRHLEQAANLNNMYGTAYGYGTVMAQAMCFEAMDRLGIAQYLSRIGLILDGNSGESLDQAKQQWMQAPGWQGVRALCEEMLVTEDWFELFVAQNIVVDSLVGSVLYTQFDEWLTDHQAHDVTMLLEFMQEWKKDRTRWIDSVIKTVVRESDHNKLLVADWSTQWHEKARAALQPVAEKLVGNTALDMASEELNKNLIKAGIN